MAKNVDHIQHIKSNVVLEGKPKLPEPGSLVEGELAINYAEGVETISIKNSSGDIVTFSSDDYYSKQKLGSAFTDANSAITVTEYIEENELIVSTALNDLKENKLDVSAYTEPTEYWISGTGENSVVLKGSSGTASGYNSVAEGYNTTAGGNQSHSEGMSTKAIGDSSHVEGLSTTANGHQSHAEGTETVASGNSSHSEGNATVASGNSSHAEGIASQAIGIGSHSEGQSSTAVGNYSHAEGGGGVMAYGTSSHAEGNATVASGTTSHAEGQSSVATGSSSHAEGYYTRAFGEYSHAEGSSTSGTNTCSHAEGLFTKASGQASHAEGNQTLASENNSHAEGQGTSATSYSSHAEGNNTKSTGSGSHAEGNGTIASESGSHAEGGSTSATSISSHAEGQGTLANGMFSHAEGNGTIANGMFSHAEGVGSSANTQGSHAEGQATLANGMYAHAEGDGTKSTGYASHTEGQGTSATNRSEHASGQYNVSNSASTIFGNSGNTLFSVGNGTADDARHNAFEIRQNGDIYIVNKDGNDVRLQDELGSGTVDQVLDNTTSASTNPVSSKAVYDAVTDNELVWTNAYVTMSGVVSSHTSNTSVHITSADRDKLDSITGNLGSMAYQNTSSYSSATQVNTALAGKVSTGDIANFFDDAKYELSAGTKHVINFYHGNTVRSTIDATDFIKDGMIDTVSAGTSGLTTVLVITWNTDAGKSQTILDIGDMFEADNYYTKSETSGATEISDALADKIASGDVVTAITESNSGSSAPVSVKVVAENEFVISTALNDLNTNKLDVTAYTPTDLSNYYTKSQTSGATELSTAFSGKLDATAYTPTDLSNYYTKSQTSGATELSTAFSAKADTATTLAGYGITDAYTKSQTSGATELSTAFGNKADTATTLAGYGITDAYTKTEIDNKLGTGFTVSSVTEVIESNERVTASALNDLNTNKLDVSAYTPTDLSNYYTKSETSGSTEISNALEGKVNTSEYATFSAETNASINDLSGQSETVAAALNNLNENKLDSTALNGYATKSGDLDGVVLKKITQSAYDALVQAGTVDPNTLYIITD